MSKSDVRIAALEKRIADLQDDIARRDTFLNSFAHELRTPLAAIVGWADMLRVITPTADRVKRGADAIERSARIQIRLIEDLLSGARFETGTLKLARQRVSLSTLLATSVDALRPLAAERRLEIGLQTTAGGGTVFADEDRLQQVLANVLTSAVKLARPGGSVQVLLDRDDVRAEVRVYYVSPDNRPPTDDDLSERRRMIDADLGLLVARQLTELHGGTLETATTDTADAFAFTIRLPLLPGGMEATRDTEPAAPSALVNVISAVGRGSAQT